MISKISVQPSTSITMKQVAKKEEETSIAPNSQSFVSKPKNDGIDALASYGKSMFNMINKLDVQPIKAIDCKNIDDIKGERVYGSDNNLVLINAETPTESTKYFISKENPNHVDYIETIDKNTNKIVFSQHCEYEDGKCVNTYVTKFNPKTGSEEACTCYENGKIVYATNYSVNKFGERICIDKSYDGDGYRVSLENTKRKIDKHLHISEDKKEIQYTEIKQTPKGTIEKNVEFYNGLPFAVEENRRSVIPNLIALEPLLDSDLKPAENFDLKAWEEKIKNAKGEETRYSNGNLESKKVVIDGEEIDAYFDFNSKLEKVITSSMQIEKNGNSLKIKEDLGNGKEKETISSKYMTKVVYNDNGYKKELAIDLKTNRPMSYRDKDESFYFNEKGMVDYIF